MTDRVTIRRALLSASDKRGLTEFARELKSLGVDIVSTGGTAAAIAAAGVPVTQVTELTGFPEILEGRVKTLHPLVYGGILYRRDREDDRRTIGRHRIPPIDLVAVTLYPFEEALARGDRSLEEMLEEIDIGGPSLLRAAAKNWSHVVVLSDPGQYTGVIDELKAGGVTAGTRRRLAAAAFRRCEAYNATIAGYLEGASGARRGPAGGAAPEPAREAEHEDWPSRLVKTWDRKEVLRYGENPHQRAAAYVDVTGARAGTDARGTETSTPERPAGLAALEQLQGKEISYNNLLDLDTGLRLAHALGEPSVVVVKHRNPCGAARGTDLERAFRDAWAGDSLSAFGGVVVLQGKLTAPIASAIAEQFVEIVAAREFDPEARAILARKKRLILLTVPDTIWPTPAEAGHGRPGASRPRPQEVRSVLGGYLVQEADIPEGGDEWRPEVVTRRAPTEAEAAALRFAWQVVRYVQSNAVLFTRGERTLGVGSGQTSRVDAVNVAIMKARREGHDLKGSVLASDAFFPFSDGVEAAAGVGCTAIVQPGGSKRDPEVIAAADAAGMAMVFTGRRAFRH
jgi:phosphoribosylaminoimidazolecarboxamide formyltransferase/IMP cyclohydrolase